MSTAPKVTYPLASPHVLNEVLDTAREWVEGTGNMFNTGSSTGFAVGAVAEFLANQRGVTLSVLRTPEGVEMFKAQYEN